MQNVVCFQGSVDKNCGYLGYESYYYYGSTALCWALALFQFLHPIHCR
jgi:hypothetical protein